MFTVALAKDHLPTVVALQTSSLFKAAVANAHVIILNVCL